MTKVGNTTEQRQEAAAAGATAPGGNEQWEAGGVNATTPAPAARTCCGKVAYTVGKNTADAYLRQQCDGPSKAAQHFNSNENRKKRCDGSDAGEKRDNRGVLSRIGDAVSSMF